MKVSIYIWLIVCLSLTVISSCKNDVINEKPSCIISSLIEGEVIIRGIKTDIIVDAIDLDGKIESVTIQIDGIEIAILEASPFQYNWDTQNETVGHHTIKATARDNNQALEYSEVNIIINKPEIEKGTLNDIEGNTYETVKIGEQWWMAEDLRVEFERDGTPLSQLHNAEEWFYVENTDKVFAVKPYEQNLGLQTKSVLYNYASATEVCPNGWHLPSNNEFEQLINYIEDNGFENRAGLALKSVCCWDENNPAYNEFGFNALPSGTCGPMIPFFNEIGNEVVYRSSTSSSETSSECLYFSKQYDNHHYIGAYNIAGVSVRCIKD